MRVLRSAVLTVGSVALLALLMLRVWGWLSPPPQDGEGRFWLGLLLAYGLLLLGALTVALNMVYLVALVFRHNRHDYRYGTTRTPTRTGGAQAGTCSWPSRARAVSLETAR